MNKKPLIAFAAASLIILGACLSVAAEKPGDAARKAKDAYPTLFSGVLSSAKLVTLPSGTLLRSGDITITRKDLDAEIAKAPTEIKGQLRKNAFFVLENKATMELLKAQAKSWSKENKREFDSDDALLRAYIDSLTEKVSVSNEEMKAFFDNNKDMIGNSTFDQIKDQLKEYLLEQKGQETVDSYIKSMGDRLSIELDKNWVRQQSVLASENVVDRVRKSGKPSLVDFGSDGCRPCEMMTPVLESLKKDYSGKLNVVFVHVRKEQILASRYGIQSIPVQIFFDKNGSEVFRHIGFFAKDQIEAKLAEMGVK